MRKLTYSQAIQEATDQCLADNPNVILIGEGAPDGVFGTTANLKQKYPERVFDSPLSENAVTGVCIGAALNGLRPIMVHQRTDFSLLSMDQIVNNAAKWFYMFGQPVPMVIRMIIGRGWGQGPQHSQSLQALFAAIPGLKVVMPTNAYDAKGMLIAAIEDNNPVIFIEHRWLHNTLTYVPKEKYTVPLDKAKIVKSGTDITIVAFSYTVNDAKLAAQALEKICISAEVIDMRSVAPLDTGIVLNSVKKTKRLIVCDTAHKTGSIAGELISQVVEQGFKYLSEAPIRLCSKDYPQPTSHFLTSDYYVTPLDIAKTSIKLMRFHDHMVDKIYKDLLSITPHDQPATQQTPF